MWENFESKVVKTMADEKKSTGGDQGQKPAQPTKQPAQQEKQAENVKPSGDQKPSQK